MCACPADLSSLEGTESNSQVPWPRSGNRDLNWSEACCFRHSGWRADRVRVYDGLVAAGTRLTVCDDFTHCGNLAYVLESIDRPGEYRVAGSTCHHRFCVPCARERSRAIATNIVAQIDGRPARFLTLTMRSTTESLSTLLAKLSTSFAKLRRRAIWLKRVKGGVSFIEVKWNPALQRWNVHLHAIVQGLYIKVGMLSQAWKAITGDSMIVDIRFVRSEGQLAKYVSKYASKPLSHTVLHDKDRLTEAILALKGRRLATTFGNWRGILLTPKPDKESWTNLGTLADFIAKAAAGDTTALHICTTLGVASATIDTATPMTRAPPVLTTVTPTQLDLPLVMIPRWTDPG